MHRFISMSYLSLALVGFGAAVTAEDAKGTCPVSEKLSKLNAEWKVAAAEAKAQPAEEQAKLHQRLAALAKECPVGSRIVPSLAATRDVLASLNASAEANAKNCPLANASEEFKKTEAFKTAEALGTARMKLVADLHQLATFATPCDAECCAAGKDKAAPATAAATATAAKSDATCSKELAARVKDLKASWAKVNDDLAKLPAAKHEEIKAGLVAMSKSSKAVALIPSTVVALSEGFDSLDSVNQKMVEWGNANPTFLASVSEEMKKSFEEQNALVRDTRDILRQAAEKMKAVAEHLAPATATALKD
jgi:hypothetical protein